LGWNTSLARPVCSVVLRNLSTWSPPDGLTAMLQNADVVYDLAYGWDFASSILDHIKTNARQGVTDIYRMALGGAPNCGIIRAKRKIDDLIVGSVVVYNDRSALAEHMPAFRAQSSVGGISSPVIAPFADDYSAIMKGLIMLAIRQIRKLNANVVVMDCVCFVPFVIHDCGWELMNANLNRLMVTVISTVFLQWALVCYTVSKRLIVTQPPGP